MIDGKKIVLAGGAEFTLPPLPLGKAWLLAEMRQHNAIETERGAQLFTDAIVYSLRRNYPDLDREVVEQGLDMLNFQTTLDAFADVNQLRVPVNASGEASAAT